MPRSAGKAQPIARHESGANTIDDRFATACDDMDPCRRMDMIMRPESTVRRQQEQVEMPMARRQRSTGRRRKLERACASTVFMQR